MVPCCLSQEAKDEALKHECTGSEEVLLTFDDRLSASRVGAADRRVGHVPHSRQRESSGQDSLFTSLVSLN